MLLSTSVCETRSYNIIYWAKEVCNQQTKFCENCSVALSYNIQVCVFFGREPFCLLHFGRGTNMDCTKLHFSFQYYLRQLFKPHRWKCDPLEANKETQQGITGNNM